MTARLARWARRLASSRNTSPEYKHPTSPPVAPWIVSPVYPVHSPRRCALGADLCVLRLADFITGRFRYLLRRAVNNDWSGAGRGGAAGARILPRWGSRPNRSLAAGGGGAAPRHCRLCRPPLEGADRRTAGEGGRPLAAALCRDIDRDTVGSRLLNGSPALRRTRVGGDNPAPSGAAHWPRADHASVCARHIPGYRGVSGRMTDSSCSVFLSGGSFPVGGVCCVCHARRPAAALCHAMLRMTFDPEIPWK